MFYKKRIAKPDTPEQIAWRVRDNEAREQAKTETRAKFPVITAENMEEAMDYREQRYQQLRPV